MVFELFDQISDAFEWANMGEREAASRIIENEITQNVNQQVEDLGYDPYDITVAQALDEEHLKKHGRSIFGSDDMLGFQNAWGKFVKSNMQGMAAATMMINPDVMGAMDAFGFEVDDINNAMQGYSNNVAMQGTNLMNVINHMTRHSRGALTQDTGGPFTEEEVDAIFEAVGKWNPDMKLVLEQGHLRGRSLNKIEEQYGLDFLDPASETFAGGDPLKSNVSAEDKNNIRTLLEAAGEVETLNALNAHWDGDTQHVSNVMNSYISSIENCGESKAGLAYDADMTPYSYSSTEWTKITQKAGTAAHDVTAEQVPYSNVTMEGVPNKRLAWDKNAIVGCIVSKESPFGTDYNQWNNMVAQHFGLSQSDFRDYLRAGEATNIVGGYLKSQTNYFDAWNQSTRHANMNGKRLGGLDISKMEIGKRTGLAYIDMNNEAHYPYFMAAIQENYFDPRQELRWFAGNPAVGKVQHVPDDYYDGYQIGKDSKGKYHNLGTLLQKGKYFSEGQYKKEGGHVSMVQDKLGKEQNVWNGRDDFFKFLTTPYERELMGLPEGYTFDREKLTKEKIKSFANPKGPTSAMNWWSSLGTIAGGYEK